MKTLNNSIEQLTLFPESWKRDWKDIEVITLLQHQIDMAYNHVLSTTNNMDDIEDQVNEELQKSKYSTAKEYINVDDNKITVGLNCDVVNDQAVELAIKLIIDVEHFNNGMNTYGPDYILDPGCIKYECIV